MLHEKHNEPYHWKGKLDELDQLPNEPERDRTLAWEKLHTRLGKKPAAWSTDWYWIAAAGILILAGLYWSWPKQHRNEIVHKEKPGVVQQPGKKSQIAREEKNANVSRQLITPVQTPKKKNLAPVKQNQIAPVTIIRKPDIAVLLDSVAIKQDVTLITANSNPMRDTMNTKLVTRSPVKKLRVVHINDLVKPKEEVPLAKSTLQIPLPRRTSGHEYPPVFFSKNSSDNLLKIKLSPSN